jgi:hypothetical protein
MASDANNAYTSVQQHRMLLSQTSDMRSFVLLPTVRTQFKQTCEKFIDIWTGKSLHFQSTSADNTDNPRFDPLLLNITLQRRFKSWLHWVFKPWNFLAKVERNIVPCIAETSFVAIDDNDRMAIPTFIYTRVYIYIYIYMCVCVCVCMCVCVCVTEIGLTPGGSSIAHVYT